MEKGCVCVVCGDGQKGKRVSIQLVSPASGDPYWFNANL